jgi:putative PEP-CTERM system histidine kinase
VPDFSSATVSAWSYGIALAGYLAFALRVAIGLRRNARAALLLAATLVTAGWAGLGVAASLHPAPWLVPAMIAADALRYGIWFAFLAILPRGASEASPFARPIFVLAFVGLLASVLLDRSLPFAQEWGFGTQAPTLHAALAVFGLVLVERLLRRAHSQARWAIKPLAIALAGVFGFDLALYADASLFGTPDVDMLIARGIANALVIPFLALSAARNRSWSVDVHFSRGTVYHSTALIVSAVFLLVVAGAGYLVRYIGGEWGRALAIELVFIALLAGALIATSGRFRSRLRVFVSKHFFSYRFDYREEWLRFSRTLSTESALQKLEERAVMALADLVESPAGALWLKDDNKGFVQAGRYNIAAVTAVEPADGSLVRFIERTGWVINLSEHAVEPGRYRDLSIPDWLAALPDAWLVVPLHTGLELLGFVVLTTPRAPVEVDWEVRDLLKTASRQAASYLGHVRAAEALLEARKFEAFNRMSAFVVHDLKNLVAQLSLMVRNAERHRDNPEFQRDMLSTVQNVVGRMNTLLMQLRTGTTPVDKPRPVDLRAVVTRVCEAKASARLALEPPPVLAAVGHEDRLERVIGHLVQNALDATAERGRVNVRLYREDRVATIEVDDTGVGMTREFVRDRLFRPFETTKSAGMGIGVYESVQYVASLGGNVLIDSTPDVGTRVRVRLPLAEAGASQAATPETA